MIKYYIGFDIGSDTINTVVTDHELKIVYSPDLAMHFGNPVETLKDVYEDIILKFGFKNIITTAFTGSVGKFIAQKTKTPYFFDTITIPLGAGRIDPEANYIFHIGAKDPYFFEKERVKVNGNYKIIAQDHGTGTKCGGGSGILITKQCRRFFENEFPVKLTNDRKKNREILQNQLQDIFKRAEKVILTSDRKIDVGGRCGVVIQSDMIHLQNRGEQISNILKGMFERIVKNYKCDVIKTRFLDPGKKGAATGGIFTNRYFLKMFEKELGINISIPENYQKAGAIGAVIRARDSLRKFKPGDLISIAGTEKEGVKMAPPLYSALDKVVVHDEEKPALKKEDLLIYNAEKKTLRSVLIGIDGGSTTTKAVIADAGDLKIIAGICLYTNGEPLHAAREAFRQIRKYIGRNIKIEGAAYTGSSGAFYFKLFTDLKKDPEKESADIVKDEITCHALGVKHFNKKIDTIFELGGQDAKFTLFNKDGTVKKAKMNLSCMAGTGQTMQNMVEMIGLDIKTTFTEYALQAERTPVVDETCGVFTEAGIAKLIAMNFSKQEIAAAIAYGFMGGYVNKFIGNEKFGEYASAQGGPFMGKECLAALALHTGMKVNAFPHRQMFGALGAVIAAYNRINELKDKGVKYKSKFRGLNIEDMEFEKSFKNCSRVIKDSCGLRDCKLQVYRIKSDIIYSGGLCVRGNTDTSIKRAPNYVEMYKKILNIHLAKYSVDINRKTRKERILIPRSLTFLNEKGVFYTALYNGLGFDVAVSPESDDTIANEGINYSHSETCYPVKLAHGHVSLLKKHLRKGKDRILLLNAISSGKEKYKFCPYVAGAGFILKDALDIDLKDSLLPVIYFDDPDYKIEKSILKDLERVFKGRFNLKEIKKAVKKAIRANREFLDEVYLRGEEIVNSLKDKGKKIFIGIGRGYTIFDDKASSKVHELFASYGLHFIPSFFLRPVNFNLAGIVNNMYWFQGQSIINYDLMTALDPQVYPVRETNFNCGTDSMLLFHEEYIFSTAEKPHLILQTDGHNSNAQFGTRTLANYEVVKNHKPKQVRLKDFRRTIPAMDLKQRIVGIPYIGDVSYIMAAGFRACGYNSEVMPTYTKRSQELARKFISTNTCRPFNFQVGDNLGWLYELKEKGIDPNIRAAVLEPKSKGPCRFGQYSVILRKFFDENGFTSVPVIDPNDDEDYTNLPLSYSGSVKLSKLFYRGAFCSDILYDALLRSRPYEKERGSAEIVYDDLRNELYVLVEKEASTKRLTEFMQKAKKRFEILVDCSRKRKPIVVMNGEIFVRCHPKANQDSIKLLERYGLEVRLNMFSQWLDYINKFNIFINKELKDFKGLFSSLLKKKFMQRVISRLYGPFADFLQGRAPHDPQHSIDTIQKAYIFEKRVGGESPLSISEVYMLLKGDLQDICGIYHVGPFGCMQETAATSKIQALIQQHRRGVNSIGGRIAPFMDAVFGESELPNLEAEIAAFAEKCYLKRELQ